MLKFEDLKAYNQLILEECYAGPVARQCILYCYLCSIFPAGYGKATKHINVIKISLYLLQWKLLKLLSWSSDFKSYVKLPVL